MEPFGADKDVQVGSMLFTLVDATIGNFSLSSAGNVWVRERDARGWAPLTGSA
jgi:hypothetical protein